MCFLNEIFEFLLRVQPSPSGHCPVLIRPGLIIPQKGQLSNMLKKKKIVPYILIYKFYSLVHFYFIHIKEFM